MAPRVVLDPGHGGTDPGAVANGLREKDITLEIAMLAAERLKREYAVEIELTRMADVTVSLEDRAAFANGRRADVFVSVHVNSNDGAPGTGFETYIHDALPDTSRAAALRSALHSTIMRTAGRKAVRDRGHKKGNLHVLRETDMPAVLTENLFINNPRDAELLRSKAFVRSLARAHATGIARGLALPKRDEVLTADASLLGKRRLEAGLVRNFIASRPHGEYDDSDIDQIVGLYLETCEEVGIDPLLSISQMILETGNLTSHWSQRPRRNPAGIGVTGEPGEGISFPSWKAAVRAHVGRLLAYAVAQGKENRAQAVLIAEALEWRPLPSTLRGSAPALEGLAGTWAADSAYADKICAVAKDLQAHKTLA